MPPTNRPRLLNSQQSPHNPINNNNSPPANIVYSIVQPSSPAPPTSLQSPTPIKPPTETEDRNLRRINREARMKANMERRNNRQLQTKPNVFLPPPNNIKNDLITPPPNNIKNDIIPPPIDNLKTPDDTTNLKPEIKNDKNIYLIGGAALVAFLVIAMNKR